MELISNSRHINRDTLLAIYCNSSATDKFIVGYPVAIAEDFLILSRIDKDGNYDGLSLCSAASIFRIEVGSNYLVELQGRSPVNPTWKFMGDPVEYFLDTLENKRQVIQIKDEDGSQIAYGIILAHTQSILRIQSIPPEGQNAEVYDIDRTLVARLSCDKK